MAVLRLFIHLIALLALLFPAMAEAYDVLIIQSSRNAAYEDALTGFRSVHRTSERLIVMSDYSEVDVVRIVREDQPRLVLAVGDSALKAARMVRHIPVVSMMALRAAELRSSAANITGIDMQINPRAYLSLCRSMKARKVGVVYHPAKSGAYIRKARMEAEQMGIELILREVRLPKGTPTQLASLSGKVDALWMLPDPFAVTRETVEAYFRFAQSEKIPVISFAAPYLGMGAAAVIEANRVIMGKQTAELAFSLLNGASVSATPVIPPRAASLKSNHSILKNLGLRLPKTDSALTSLQE